MSQPTFSFTTTAQEVATVFAKEIQGENSEQFQTTGMSLVSSELCLVLITGTSVNGIGFETARVLAKHANLIIITGHNSERLKLFLLPGYLLNADECTD
jgi:hypothetical protein